MAFSFSITDPTGNTSDTASVALDVSPTTPIIAETNMTPGTTATGTVQVSNTGSIDEFWQVTVNWSPTGTTSTAAATRLVSELAVSITAGSPTATTTPVFTGTMYDEIDQPSSPGQSLTLAQAVSLVQFQVSLPSTATSVYENIDVGFDIQFVALS